jgi:hypothetical protein
MEAEMLADMLLGAIAVRAHVIDIDGAFYAALCDNGRWNIWELDRFDSPVYYTDDLRKCTCPRGGTCKHILALRELDRPAPRPADPRRGR